MSLLYDNGPASYFNVPPPFIGGDKMHPPAGLRWCIAVSDDDEELAVAVRLLNTIIQVGFSEEIRVEVVALFDRFRSRWAQGSFECQRMDEGFDFRRLMRGPA